MSLVCSLPEQTLLRKARFTVHDVDAICGLKTRISSNPWHEISAEVRALQNKANKSQTYLFQLQHKVCIDVGAQSSGICR